MLPIGEEFDPLIEELIEKGEDYRLVYRNGKHLVTRGKGKDDKVAAVIVFDPEEETE